MLTVGQMIALAKSDKVLGIDDREVILETAQRALELAMYKANYDVMLGTIDVASDACGVVTLPSCIGTVLQVNVGGLPTILRDSWYQFHVNGFGNQCGPCCLFSTMNLPTPVWQQPSEWSLVTALCEDATDGDGSKVMIVQGETMDASGNIKPATTIPVSGPSSVGIRIPLLNGVANTDSAANPTYFRKFTSVYKPVTRGFVKLIAFPLRQMALATVLGYYGPNETTPQYQQLKVKASCTWVRIRYRRATLKLVDDHEIVPISSTQAMVNLLKAVRFSDDNNLALSEQYLSVAVRLLNEIQAIDQGNKFSPLQVDGSWFAGTIDYR